MDCNYCNRPAKLLNSPYGMRWECQPCDARVGCHDHTTIPLGTLANAKLRILRQQAHGKLDALWNSGGIPRKVVYAMVADWMGLEPKQAHIAKLNEEQCHELIEILDWRKTNSMLQGERKMPGEKPAKSNLLIAARANRLLGTQAKAKKHPATSE